MLVYQRVSNIKLWNQRFQPIGSMRQQLDNAEPGTHSTIEARNVECVQGASVCYSDP